MSQLKWYELYSLLAKKLNNLYKYYENNKEHSLKTNYEKGNEYFFKFLESKQNKFFGEIVYAICSTKDEFTNLFNWSKNISEKSIDPFHIFVSFNNNNITLDNKIERLQFYFDVFNINVNVVEHSPDNRSSSPHITPVKLLTNRTKKTQDEIWQFFSAVMDNDDKGIKKGFDKYKNWYGIAFPVMTEFLFWINSTKNISLDKNTQKLLLKFNTVNKIPKNYDDYIELIKKRNDSDNDTFRLIVKYSYDNEIPANEDEKRKLFAFLNGTNNSEFEVNTNLQDLVNKFELIGIKVLNSHP